MDELHRKQIICDDCETQLPFTHFEQMQNNPIEKIFWGRTNISNAMAILFFTKESMVQQIIFELKYKQNKKAGLLLGKIIATTLKETIAMNDNTFLVPIPYDTLAD